MGPNKFTIHLRFQTNTMLLRKINTAATATNHNNIAIIMLKHFFFRNKFHHFLQQQYIVMIQITITHYTASFLTPFFSSPQQHLPWSYPDVSAQHACETASCVAAPGSLIGDSCCRLTLATLVREASPAARVAQAHWSAHHPWSLNPPSSQRWGSSSGIQSQGHHPGWSHPRCTGWPSWRCSSLHPRTVPIYKINNWLLTSSQPRRSY